MKSRISRAALACVFLSGCLGGVARSQQSQQESSPPQQQSQEKDANSQQKPDTPADNSNPALDNGTVAPATAAAGFGTNADALQVQQMHGATPLPTGRVSALQFGPVYMQSADFYQALEAISASTLPNPSFESVSIFRTDLVLDRAWKTSRFAVQYEPRLMITNGVVQTSTANLTAAWDTLFAITPRLSLGLKNNFGYFSQKAQFGGLNLEGDLTTGTLVQAQFLEGPGHFLNDRSEADVRYLLSARNRIDVTPFFEYYSASGTQDVYVNESKSPGVEFGFSRLLSPTKTIGFGYTIEDTIFGNLLPRTLYQTVDVTYAQAAGPTWRYAATAGVTRATTPIGPAQTTWVGTFDLIKLFRDSKLTFQYNRGQQVGFQIANGFAELYDVAYERRLTQRATFTMGVGYYRQFLAATDTSGLFVAPGLEYQIANRWFLETLYTFKNQQNGGANFASGKLNFGSVGIRWEPGYRPAAFH